jgi:hypothetical protein
VFVQAAVAEQAAEGNQAGADSEVNESQQPIRHLPTVDHDLALEYRPVPFVSNVWRHVDSRRRDNLS